MEVLIKLYSEYCTINQKRLFRRVIANVTYVCLTLLLLYAMSKGDDGQKYTLLRVIQG